MLLPDSGVCGTFTEACSEVPTPSPGGPPHAASRPGTDICIKRRCQLIRDLLCLGTSPPNVRRRSSTPVNGLAASSPLLRTNIHNNVDVHNSAVMLIRSF